MYIILCLCYIADECPEDRFLNKFVREAICAAGSDVWKDLGVELMGQKAVLALNKIEVDNTGNVARRCSAMFTLWRQRQPKANWRQLIKALEQINLNTLANTIEELLSPSIKQQYTSEQSQIKEDIEQVQEDCNLQQLDDGMYMKSDFNCVH